MKIQDKLYYSISEVSELTGLEPFVLRYWEKEFSKLRPSKSPRGQRIYQKKDIEVVRLIKKLLYDEKFTIEGAKNRLNREKEELKKVSFDKGFVDQIKKELADLKKILKS
ncbi:MAG: MerR family transcriptional regulator [Candidatus Aureabacteria bacterium]|nr:MerR family transcriptional regulator [Candidatus Auribacterota bacterium]